jgi:flagellar biosynthesis/type III secretory pathway M-ring protein FliF/YscJ
MCVTIAKIYNKRKEEEALALKEQVLAEAAAARAIAGDATYGFNVMVGDEDEYEGFDEDGNPIQRIDTNSNKNEILTELENFIERAPEAAVMMLRNWISED